MSKGREPWITPPEEDGGADLKAKLEKIEELARITDDEVDIYCELCISATTWFKYKNLYKAQFTDVLERGWRQTMTRIKQGMLRKALEGDYNAQRFCLERKAKWIEEKKHDMADFEGGPLEIKFVDSTKSQEKPDA